MGLTKDQIMERLKFQFVTLTDAARHNAFSTAVDKGRRRNIVLVHGEADASAHTVKVEKLAADGTTYTTIFNTLNIAANANVDEPNAYNIESPIIVLEGGANLTFTANAITVNMTVIYWDDEIV